MILYFCLGSYGNLFPALVCYKMNKVLGSHSITYLSNRYLDSDYIYEMGRGEIDPNKILGETDELEKKLNLLLW